MATNVTAHGCINLGLECEFIGVSCTTGDEEKIAVICRNNRCYYEYGCYLHHILEEEILAVTLGLSFLYLILFGYCLYLLRNAFVAKRRSCFNKLTVLVLLCLFACFFRGFNCCTKKKQSYDNTSSYILEAVSEMFQVSAAFYFPFIGWQLSTKATKLQKTVFTAVIEKTKQIVAVTIFLLAARLLFRIIRLNLVQTLLRVIFSILYGFFFCVFGYGDFAVTRVHKQSKKKIMCFCLYKISTGLYVLFF